MKVDGLTNDEVKSHLQVCSVPLRFPRHGPLFDQAAPSFQPCFPVASTAEIPAAHAARRRRPAGGDGLVVWVGAAAAVHGVAAQLVAAVRLAPGPPAAHRVYDRGGQLRR
jgi:hypothetical protein